jgi:hypothetical protein
MKNYQFFWPTIVAIALSCTLVSCYNDKLKNDYEEEQRSTIENVSLEETFDLDKYELDPIITVEEYLEEINQANTKTR